MPDYSSRGQACKFKLTHNILDFFLCDEGTDFIGISIYLPNNYAWDRSAK